MAQVFVSIGSNIDQEKYIHIGIAALHNRYKPIICSTVYESEAVGFVGENFYNLVVGFETTDAIEKVSTHLAKIEDDNGRDRNKPRFSARTLDLDLLLYDFQILETKSITLPRPEIVENAFVLLPLSEIAGEMRDPITNHTYSDLWNRFDQGKQKLWPIECDIPELSKI